LAWSISVKPNINAYDGIFPIETDAASVATEDTIAYYWVLVDGNTAATVQVNKANGGSYSIPLSSLHMTSGAHTLSVEARGMPSILNQYSPGISYTQP
jgi:hypothetical protein